MTTLTSNSPHAGLSRFGSIFGLANNPSSPRAEDAWYIPYHHEDQDQMIPRGRARTRSSTVSTTLSPQSFFTFDGGSAGIGESPRTSYSTRNFRASHDKSSRGSFGKVLSFSGQGREVQSERRSPQTVSMNERERGYQDAFIAYKADSLSQPNSVVARQRAKSSPQQRPRHISREQAPQLPDFHPPLGIGNSPGQSLFPFEANISPMHPYALAKSPPTPPTSAPPLRQTKPAQHLPPTPTPFLNLRSSSSVPNLRNKSSFPKLHKRQVDHHTAQSWCDALVFPRPRLKAHRLSFTPPTTPMDTLPRAPQIPMTVLDSADPDVMSISSAQENVVKAVREGERRMKEKEHWNALAQHSFQNSRSRRSLSRRRKISETSTEPPRTRKSSESTPLSFGGMQRGVDIIAQTVFSQGTSRSSGTTSSLRTHSRTHSGNTSAASERKWTGVQQNKRTSDPLSNRMEQRDPLTNGYVMPSARHRVDSRTAPSPTPRHGEPDRDVQQYGSTTQLYVKLPSPKPPISDISAQKEIGVNGNRDRRGSFLLEKQRNSRLLQPPENIGIALASPSQEGLPLDDLKRDFAGPHLSSPSAAQTDFPGDIASRHRRPPRGVPPPAPYSHAVPASNAKYAVTSSPYERPPGSAPRMFNISPHQPNAGSRRKAVVMEPSKASMVAAAYTEESSARRQPAPRGLPMPAPFDYPPGSAGSRSVPVSPVTTPQREQPPGIVAAHGRKPEYMRYKPPATSPQVTDSKFSSSSFSHHREPSKLARDEAKAGHGEKPLPFSPAMTSVVSGKRHHDNPARRSLLGAYAYGVVDDETDNDDTPLGVEEALTRSLRKPSVESLKSPETPVRNKTAAPPLPDIPQPSPSSVRSDGPLTSTPTRPRYESIRFDRVHNLSTIESVDTPSSHTASQRISSPVTERPAALNVDSPTADHSKETIHSRATSDSSPTSEGGPRMLSDNDDPELYKNLFYRGSPTPPVSPVSIQKAISEQTSSPSAFRPDVWEDSSLRASVRSSDGLHGLRRKISEDLQIPVDSPTKGYGSGEMLHGRGESGSSMPLSSSTISSRRGNVPLTISNISPGRKPQQHQDSQSIPQDVEVVSIASSSLSSTEEDEDFTLRRVQHRVSMASPTVTGPRPASTHPDLGGQDDLTASPQLRQPSSRSPEHLMAPSSNDPLISRDSAYSGMSNESNVSHIITSFPSPPIPSAAATPSTLLDSYFTATDNTPMQSRDVLPQAVDLETSPLTPTERPQ